jgi:hypothetical protein
MIKLAVVLIFALWGAHAGAVDWICTTSQQIRPFISEAELPQGATGASAATGTTRRRAGLRRIDKADLVQAYSGQPVLMGSTWLLAVMLPASHPDSRLAFSDLGLSAAAAERMASGSSLIDRGIRVVQSQEQMIQKVTNNPPAVGYSSIFFGARDVAMCF